MRWLVLLFVIALTSCGKDQLQDPVFNNYPLIATWISAEGFPVFEIKDLENRGTTEKYYEYQQGSARLLRRTYNNIPVTYEIIFIDAQVLRLVDRANGEQLTMYKLRDK